MSISYELKKGGHASREQGMCAMEWTAYIAGEPHSARPKCVDPVLIAHTQLLNDLWSPEDRQRLRPYLARMIGTADDGVERREVLRDQRLAGVVEHNVDANLALLDALLPTEAIDLPEAAATEYKELCNA